MYCILAKGDRRLPEHTCLSATYLTCKQISYLASHSKHQQCPSDQWLSVFCCHRMCLTIAKCWQKQAALVVTVPGSARSLSDKLYVCTQLSLLVRWLSHLLTAWTLVQGHCSRFLVDSCIRDSQPAVSFCISRIFYSSVQRVLDTFIVALYYYYG